MSNEIVVNARTRGFMIMSIIIMTVTAARTAARAATRAAVFQGSAMILSMIRVMSVTVAVWQRIGMMKGQKRSCMRFGELCRLAQIVKIFGHLCTSGSVVHFTFSPFNIVGIISETALVMDTWQTGITLLTHLRTVPRLVIGTTGGWSGRCGCGIIIITRSEGIMIATRGLAFLFTLIILFINFWVDLHHNGLERNS